MDPIDEFVRRQLDLAVDRVHRIVRPLGVFSDTEDPEPAGSAVLIWHRGKRYLVTAAHVLDLLPPGKGHRPLSSRNRRRRYPGPVLIICGRSRKPRSGYPGEGWGWGRSSPGSALTGCPGGAAGVGSVPALRFASAGMTAGGRKLSFGPARAVRDAVARPSRRAGDAGWPRVVWAGCWCSLPAVREKRDIPRPRDRLRASWITEVFHLLDPWPAAERPGCSCPVPCGTAPAFERDALLLSLAAKQHSDGPDRSIASPPRR